MSSNLPLFVVLLPTVMWCVWSREITSSNGNEMLKIFESFQLPLFLLTKTNFLRILKLKSQFKNMLLMFLSYKIFSLANDERQEKRVGHFKDFPFAV